MNITPRIVLSIIALLFSTLLSAKTQKVSIGTLEQHIDFASQYIGTRTVTVWLPDLPEGRRAQHVLFMHDGQMLFDADTTWNGQAWEVEEVASRLMSQGHVKDFIVVGIDNGGRQRRGREFFPQRVKSYFDRSVNKNDFSYLRQPLYADNYLKFIVKELKPFIAKRFAVKTDKAHSFIAGSSMGGLISLYAISEYPDEFAGAACLSTHWPGSMPVAGTEVVSEAILTYLHKHLPEAGGHRLYFDYGTETLDRHYGPWQRKVDELMAAKGYSSQNWQTRKFEGAAHDEVSWHKRLHVPLVFLLQKRKLID